MSDSGPQAHWLAPVLVALIGAFMSILDSSIVNVAIPTIMNVFNASTDSVQWVSTVYMLALGVIVPLSGWLGDKLGYKRLYIISMGVFIGGSLLCGLSWSMNSLIAARVIQAFGGGMIMPTTMAMIYRMVPRDKIGGGMGSSASRSSSLPPSAPPSAATSSSTWTGDGSSRSTFPSGSWASSCPSSSCPSSNPSIPASSTWPGRSARPRCCSASFWP